MSINELTITLNLGNVAYILIVFSACLPSFAKHFYMSYRLIFGTLYPTYLSFKALKQKDDKECARMMMYWIVFAIFSFIEGFLDIFVGFWFPFYSESKIIFLFWLISPYGNGAKILYENFVHKKMEEHEQVIDEFISSMKHISIDLFWKAWAKCSVYANYMLIQLFTNAQIAFIQYMSNRNETHSIMQNPFANLNSSLASGGDAATVASAEQKAEIHAKQIEKTKDPTNEKESEQSAPIQADSMITDDDEALEVKKPGRKTKRKRRVVTDISSKATVVTDNVRMTRSKARQSESQSTSDVEML